MKEHARQAFFVVGGPHQFLFATEFKSLVLVHSGVLKSKLMSCEWSKGVGMCFFLCCLIRIMSESKGVGLFTNERN